jgi:predicted GNAT family acetyltransferase
MATQVRDNPAGERFEIYQDGEYAGATFYYLVDGGIAFDHTEIDDRFEGQGLGSTLVREALDDVRKRGWWVLPFCQFMRGYIQRHREYADLVPADRRAQFGL